MSETKHILGLSGGKDSAALAVHMNKKYPDQEEKNIGLLQNI